MADVTEKARAKLHRVVDQAIDGITKETRRAKDTVSKLMPNEDQIAYTNGFEAGKRMYADTDASSGSEEEMKSEPGNAPCSSNDHLAAGAAPAVVRGNAPCSSVDANVEKAMRMIVEEVASLTGLVPASATLWYANHPKHEATDFDTGFKAELAAEKVVAKDMKEAKEIEDWIFTKILTDHAIETSMSCASIPLADLHPYLRAHDRDTWQRVKTGEVEESRAPGEQCEWSEDAPLPPWRK